MRKFILVILCVTFTNINANNFVDAIRNGNSSGDIYLLYDFVNSSPNESGKYQNSQYLATSFGLYYKSMFYGYFRTSIGFRGAVPLFEVNKNRIFGKNNGKGDATRDFWDSNRAMLARTYLEYFDGDTSVKLGRIEDDTDLISNHFDGIWISNKTLGFMLIDFVWMNRYGTTLPRELSGFYKVGNLNDSYTSKYGGSYYLGLTFDIFDFMKFKVYGLTSPQIYSFVATKADFEFNHLNLVLDYVAGFEHKKSSFGDSYSHLFNVYLGGNYNIFSGKIGYINTSNKNGMGSLSISGNSFNPFFYFSGDALNYQRNLNLFYARLGIDSSILDTYLVYGYNLFKLNHSLDTSSYSQGEINLYFNWHIVEGFNMIAYFVNTHGAKKAIPNITQFGISFGLGF